MNATISAENIKFLRDLKKNNDRDWFNENKDRYTRAHENTIEFAETVFALLSRHDDLKPVTGNKSLMRIYRDTRFSKDKTPYKTYWGGGFSRDTDALRGGYYFHVEPGGNTYVGGGFYNPSSADIQHIRNHIAADDRPLRKVLTSKSFRNTFGEIRGQQLKTAPKGFEKDHPAIDLLRYKQMYALQKFSDKQVTSPDFPKLVVANFRKLRPFFDCMSEILTTDLNGRSTLE